MELDPQTKRSIERFNNKSTFASRILIVWFSALLVLWMSALEPKAREVTKYNDTKVAYRDVAEKFSPRTLLPTNNSEEKTSKLQALKYEKNEAKDKVLIPFKLPGGIEVPIDIVWAPVIWIALALGILLFMLVERHSLLTLAARVTNKIESAPELLPILSETLTEAPFWIAPVANQHSQRVTASNQMAVLGWENDRTRAILYMVGCTIVLAVEGRILALTFAFSAQFGSFHERWLAPSIGLIFFIISLFAIVYSLFPYFQSVFPSSNRASTLKLRRGFLLAAVVIVVGVPLLFTRARLPLKGLARVPRFRIKKRPQGTVISSIQTRGLHINKNSGVVHYITDSTQLLGVQALHVENLLPISVDKLKLASETPHVNLKRASAIFELAALDFLEKGDFLRACEVLMMAVRYNKALILKGINKAPDFRLLDLLAGLSVRHNLPNYFTQILDELNLNGKDELVKSQESLILTRVRKWQAPESKWRKKWQDKSKPVKWGALSM